MIGRMPISGRQDGPTVSAEVLNVAVDGRYEVVAFPHSHGAAWEKVVLWIEKKEGGLPVRLWNGGWVRKRFFGAFHGH